MTSVFIVIVYQSHGGHPFDIHHVCSSKEIALEFIQPLESHGYAWEIYEWEIDSIEVGSFIGSHEDVRALKERMGIR